MRKLLSGMRFGFVLALGIGAALEGSCTQNQPPTARQARGTDGGAGEASNVVEIPVSVNSPENEFLGGGGGGSNTAIFPLVKVDLPNNRDGEVKISTFMDGVGATATTQPAEPTTKPTTLPIEVYHAPVPRPAVDDSAPSR